MPQTRCFKQYLVEGVLQNRIDFGEKRIGEYA